MSDMRMMLWTVLHCFYRTHKNKNGAWRDDVPVVNDLITELHGTRVILESHRQDHALVALTSLEYIIATGFKSDAVGTLMDPRIAIKMLVIYKRILQGPFFFFF